MTERVLIVDDDAVFRARLRRAFETRGLTCLVAADADEARTCLEKQTVHRAVVDLRMPGENGLELLQWMRAEHAHVEVVILTGYGSIANAVDAVRMGAVNYVAKPAGAADILAAFDRAHQPPQTQVDQFESPSLARAEWELINRVLSDCNGNISEAARRLGIHRRSLQRKLQKYPPRT
jgi:two-component system response regulator RegA